MLHGTLRDLDVNRVIDLYVECSHRNKSRRHLDLPKRYLCESFKQDKQYLIFQHSWWCKNTYLFTLANMTNVFDSFSQAKRLWRCHFTGLPVQTNPSKQRSTTLKSPQCLYPLADFALLLVSPFVHCKTFSDFPTTGIVSLRKMFFGTSLIRVKKILSNEI